MIVRDQYDIIVQHPTMDGGDSASRTGMMALCGTWIDQKNLTSFMTNYTYQSLVRHPRQDYWSMPTQTSRDQLVCWAAGVSSLPYHKGMLRWCIEKFYAGSSFINKDYLAPDVRLYLYKCAGIDAPLLIRLLGWPLFLLSFIWNTKVKPSDEQNQFICICIVMGKWWTKRLYKWHPDLEKNLRDYWGGWRDQMEIADTIIKKIKESI